MGRSLGVLSPPLAQMGEPECAELVVPPHSTELYLQHRPAPGRFQRAALAYDGVPVPLHAAVRWDRHVIRLDFGGQPPEMSLSSHLRLRLLGFATWLPAGAALVTLVEQAQSTSRPSQASPAVVSSHRWPITSSSSQPASVGRGQEASSPQSSAPSSRLPLGSA
jgi:hypothetical protein